MMTDRITWIDWMKTIGMFFIILGHFFSYGYTFVYTFSVPLFFAISGFLSKKENNQIIFWKKILFNLLIPLLIICFMLYPWKVYTTTNGYMSFPFYLQGICLGSQQCLDTCWFIYTLLLIKVIFQYTPFNKFFHALLFGGLTVIALFLNSHDIQAKNAFFNVTVAFQPFIMGYYIKRYTTFLNKPTSPIIEAVLLICFIAIIWVCGHLNGDVWMYRNCYGNHFSLFIIGSIAGTGSVFLISKNIPNKMNKIAFIISKGNIVILGFQMTCIYYIRLIFPTKSGLDIILSLLLLLLFVPIIMLFERYFPYLLGLYRNNTHSDSRFTPNK